jgi:hypothetical protein
MVIRSASEGRDDLREFGHDRRNLRFQVLGAGFGKELTATAVV